MTMTYQVLSLKWRPQTFSDVVGQDHVTKTLKNAFIKERIAQGYIFTGPRGVGKTTMARLMAKGLNCIDPVDYEPCNQCSNCQEIAQSRNFDVLEIDGASNRGIDDVRNLRENIKFAPMNAKFKVYIIDEVHMLTREAFNALLRTLEEPPKHGLFILCTTDIQKLPQTIISRCQRFDFNRIQNHVIAERLEDILKKEKIKYDQESIAAISMKADGSMRDALSILDQIIAFAGDEIVFNEITNILGLIPFELYFDITSAIKGKNAALLLKSFDTIRSLGTPILDAVHGLNQHLRNLLISTVSGAAYTLEISSELQQRYTAETALWERRDLIRLSNLFVQLETEIKKASQPLILFELYLLKTLEFDQSVSIENILNRPVKETVSSPKTQYPLPVEKKQQEINTVSSGNRGKGIEQSIHSEKSVLLKEPQLQMENPSVADLELNQIINHWPQLIAEIKKIKNTVAMVLEETYPKNYINNKLEVEVFDQPQFNVDRLEMNKALIEKTFKGIFEKDVRMVFILNNNHKQNEPPQMRESENGSKNNESIMNRVIEMFDGEMIR